MVRKKNEAIQNRQKGNYRPESNQEKKKTNIWSKENTGLLARMQRDMEQNEEEERTWARSKSILERKTRIYNSLKVLSVFFLYKIIGIDAGLVAELQHFDTHLILMRL
jgi:hypothetical protein